MKRYTYKELEKDCVSLAKQIPWEFSPKKTSIVAITTGGLIPATILAKLLKIKEIYTIGYSSYKGRVRNQLKRTTKLYEKIDSELIILVDDIVDSGNTMVTALTDIQKATNFNQQIFTVVLHYKPFSDFLPDLYAHKTTQWIEYPWEKFEKIKLYAPNSTKS